MLWASLRCGWLSISEIVVRSRSGQKESCMPKRGVLITWMLVACIACLVSAQAPKAGTLPASLLRAAVFVMDGAIAEKTSANSETCYRSTPVAAGRLVTETGTHTVRL